MALLSPPEIWKVGISLLTLYATAKEKSNEIHGMGFIRHWKCEFFVKLIKKSLTICLRQNREVDSDFLRRVAGGIRYCRAAGGHSL